MELVSGFELKPFHQLIVMTQEIRDEASVEEDLAEPLGRCSVFFYAIGHMLNDITSACWFTYLLVFLTQIGLNPRDAATVMLSGQVADAFAIIFTGELIDRFGHFKWWHAGGSILVAVSFSSVFGGCLPCKIFGSNSLTLQTIGYSVFAAIFNVGFAATQVANLTLYAVALAVFSVSEAKTSTDVKNQALLAFYVINDLLMPQSSKALEMKWDGKRLKVFFTAGAILWTFSGVGILMLSSTINGFMYLLSVTVGVANALMTVTAVSMESVLVGAGTNGCAFVYGSLSFLEKVSCGVALYVLESYQGTSHNLGGCPSFFGCVSMSRYGLGLVPGLCAILGAVVTYSMDLTSSNPKPLMEPLLG
ncbi:hypothetical protein ACLOJK_021059 [Asimina triloba]